MHRLDPRRNIALAFIALALPLAAGGAALAGGTTTPTSKPTPSPSKTTKPAKPTKTTKPSKTTAKPAPSKSGPHTPSAGLEAKHFAVIGDTPYGDTFTPIFGDMIAQLNADKQLGFVGHVGDVKTGSSPCTDDYLNGIKKSFDTSTRPLIYTPGDNEWTDCHRTKSDPLERLNFLRSTFFAKPGTTLGKQHTVTVGHADVPENVRWFGNAIEFASLHVVGSNNSLVPWDGLGKKEATPEQIAEQKKRMDAAINHLAATFADATQRKARAVVLLQQADMFDPSTVAKKNYTAFTPLVQALVKQSAAFGKPVYLINGDSHTYQVITNPVQGDWATRYGVTTKAPNLTAVTVPGEGNACTWLKFTVDPSSKAKQPLSWTQQKFSNCPAPTAAPKQ